MTTPVLESYLLGRWVPPATESQRPLCDAATGEAVAMIGDSEADFGAVADYARRHGAALRRLTFPQRATMLKTLAVYLQQRLEHYYTLSAATGATRGDSWIDIEGGIHTLFSYASRGRRELPDSALLPDGPPEPLTRDGNFAAQHVFAPLQGCAVHINAFNFPCWGMLEKLAPALLAGVPCIVKPASPTAWLAAAMFRDIIESGVLPEGAVQLVTGSVGDLVDHLECQDLVAFTGSAATGLALRSHQRVQAESVRFNLEADSLNCSLLGSTVRPGDATFQAFVAEVAREITVKCGQKCTAIRRVLVPDHLLDATIEALAGRLHDIRPADPRDPQASMGALAGRAQLAEVRERIEQLLQEAEPVFGDADAEVPGLPNGAFMAPLVLLCRDPATATTVHDIEAFGPVATLMPYRDIAEAAALARRGRGSLVASVFSADRDEARELALQCAPWHGRLLLVDDASAAHSTGHGSPLPNLVHGGPGRAGGGEELGGLRGVMRYMQRTAIQGSPDVLAGVCERWMAGARSVTDDCHPFRKTFGELEPGDRVVAGPRSVTLADIEAFAELTGDRFYAHMDEQAARQNPFFDGRVAHGYFIVSLAAGLFVDPAPGPVLANYGLENLRFLAPVYPGDRLTVTLTCKQKAARGDGEYGEVRWDTTVHNQELRVVAQYEVLTLVAMDYPAPGNR